MLALLHPLQSPSEDLLFSFLKIATNAHQWTSFSQSSGCWLETWPHQELPLPFIHVHFIYKCCLVFEQHMFLLFHHNFTLNWHLDLDSLIFLSSYAALLLSLGHMTQFLASALPQEEVMGNSVTCRVPRSPNHFCLSGNINFLQNIDIKLQQS